MAEHTTKEVTPDSLMGQFKGKGLKPIVMFTLVVHAVLIIGSSIPFFVRKAMSSDNSKRSEAERIESAVEDATAALRKIAKKHGLNPQDISSQFSGGSRAGKSAGGAAATPGVGPKTADVPEAAPEREKSAYETNLEAKAEGPTVPSFDDEEEDIF